MEIIQLTRLHRVREAQHRGQRYLVPRQRKECGLEDVPLDAHRERRSAPSSTTTRRKPASARSSARSPASAARSRAQVRERGQGAEAIEIAAQERPEVPGRAQVPARQEGGARRDRPRPTASRVTTDGGEMLACEVSGRAGQGQAGDHRPAREGHGGERAGRDELRALARRARSGSTPDFYQKVDVHVHFPEFVPQGRAERGRHDGDQHRQRADARCRCGATSR